MSIMKNQMLSLALVTFALSVFTSCKKDPEEIKAAIAESQVAVLVENALQEGMAGLTEQIETAVAIAEANISAQCGTTKDTVINVENSTAIGSAEYETTYTWTLECEGDAEPSNFDFVCHSEGNYNNNRMSSNDYGDANWVLTGLNENITEFTANGNYSRNGEQTFKTEGVVTESNMDLVASNLTINKTSEEITGGSAEFTVTGTADTGESFNFEGQITFKGNGKATLEINGKTFNLSL